MSGFLNKIIRGALGGILNKPKKDLGNLPIEKPVDLERRNVLSGIAAAPLVAGALNEVPARKIIDDVFLKGAAKVSNKIPISSFRNMLTNSVQMRRAVLKDEMNKGGLDDIMSGADDIFDKKFTSVDQLNDSEIDDLYEAISSRPTPYDKDHPFMRESEKLGIKPELRAAESEIKSDVNKILNEYDLSPESFVEGTESTGDLLDLFVEEMKKSNYTDAEITEFLNESLSLD